MVLQVHDNYATFKTVAANLEFEITNPITSYVKEMESFRRSLIDDGCKQTNILQETYVALKKAKQNHDDALSAHVDIKDSHLKVSRLPSTKEKEMDKWNQKLSQSSDKVSALEIIYKQCDDVCKSAQIKYWQQIIPDILQQLYTKEEERCYLVHECLKNWTFVDKQYAEYLVQAYDYMTSKVEAIDITCDLEELFTEHMNVVDGDESTGGRAVGAAMPAISVRSLVNPIKAGRILKKADENESSWKSRYFVLMGDRGDPCESTYQAGSGRLYYFESEDALKPKGIIDLTVASLYSVDESLFTTNRQNLFIIATSITTTENNQLVTKHKTHYLSAENADEKDQWIELIKRYALCCKPCIVSSLAEPVTLNLDDNENVVVNFPKANPREYYFRIIRSVRLCILEAKDLHVLDPSPSPSSPNADAHFTTESFFPLVQKQVFSPFCTISVNDARIAKTTVKTSSNPFWGEEFFFDNISFCEDTFKITVHAQTRRRDVTLGYVNLSLSEFADFHSCSNCVCKKWEGWIPLQGLGLPLVKKDGGDDLQDQSQHQQVNGVGINGNPAIRVSAIVAFESILPLYEYPIFVNCLFGDEFQLLKTLAKSAERCTSFARDEFARSLINVLVATQSDIAAIRALLSVDVEATDDPNIIFRGNTLATKAIDQYMKFVGSEFLKNTFSKLIKLVYERANKQESCEVDPTRIDNPTDEVLKKHQKRLLSWVQLFWDAIQNSVEKAPRNLREALQSIREMVIKQFSHRSSHGSEKEIANINQVQYSAVSGFIFLRFLCPAVLNPKLFGLWPEISENTTATRTLTLIAKVLQNLANLSDFKSKEPHMEFCNQWILWNLDAMKTCIMHFSTAPPADNNSNDQRYAFLIEHTLHIDLSREFNHLYLHIMNNLSDLKAQYEDLITPETPSEEKEVGDRVSRAGMYKRIDPNSLFSLFNYLEKLGGMYEKYDAKWKINKDELLACAHLQKQLKIFSLQTAAMNSPPITIMQLPNGGDAMFKIDKKKFPHKNSIGRMMISEPTLITSSTPDLSSNQGSTNDLSRNHLSDQNPEQNKRITREFDDSLPDISSTAAVVSNDKLQSRRPSKMISPPQIPNFRRRPSLNPSSNNGSEDMPHNALPESRLSSTFSDEIEKALQQKMSEGSGNNSGQDGSGSNENSGIKPPMRSTSRPPTPIRALTVPIAAVISNDDEDVNGAHGSLEVKKTTMTKKLLNKLFKKNGEDADGVEISDTGKSRGRIPTIAAPGLDDSKK